MLITSVDYNIVPNSPNAQTVWRYGQKRKKRKSATPQGRLGIFPFFLLGARDRLINFWAYRHTVWAFGLFGPIKFGIANLTNFVSQIDVFVAALSERSRHLVILCISASQQVL